VRALAPPGSRRTPSDLGSSSATHNCWVRVPLLPDPDLDEDRTGAVLSGLGRSAPPCHEGSVRVPPSGEAGTTREPRPQSGQTTRASDGAGGSAGAATGSRGYPGRRVSRPLRRNWPNDLGGPGCTPTTGDVGKSSESPWPLIQELHGERFCGGRRRGGYGSQINQLLGAIHYLDEGRTGPIVPITCIRSPDATSDPSCVGSQRIAVRAVAHGPGYETTASSHLKLRLQ
jgi:hypothetical protein